MSEYRLYQRQAMLGKVRLLRDRLRTGTLAAERLELAGYLGDPAALEVLGSPVATPSELEDWVLGLEDYGPEALIRATFAAVRFLLPLWEARYSSDSRLRLALDAADAWADDPNSRRARTSSAAARQAELAAIDANKVVNSGEADLAEEAAAAVAEAVAVVTEVVVGVPSSYTTYATVAAETVMAWQEGVPGDVRDAIRAAVTPWALRR